MARHARVPLSTTLRRLTGGLSKLGVTIVSFSVRPLPEGVLDELILSAPGSVDRNGLVDALGGAGG